MLSNTCKKSEEMVMFSLGGKSTNTCKMSEEMVMVSVGGKKQGWSLSANTNPISSVLNQGPN